MKTTGCLSLYDLVFVFGINPDLISDFQKVFILALEEVHFLFIFCTRANRPSLAEHILRLGPKQWRITGQRLLPWNRLFGFAFHSAAALLASSKTTRDLWHTAAINGHTNFSKVFPLSPAEGTVLAGRGVLTVSQLLEINDLTGRLTTDENRALFKELAIFPHLQHKLRLFVRVFR
jgi:hypothetical protein